MMIQPNCSSSSLQPCSPTPPPQASRQPVISATAMELIELSRRIPLDPKTPEFSLVARHYQSIRINYHTTNPSGPYLALTGSRECSYLTANTLIQIFALAHQKGIFQTKPLDVPSEATASPAPSAASASPAAASAAASSMRASGGSEVDLSIAEKGLVIIAKDENELGDERFYVRFNPTLNENPLSIVRLPHGLPLGKGSSGIVYKILNVSKGIFEALKVAHNHEDKERANRKVSYLKREYTVLNWLQQQRQRIANNEIWPFQAAPHQLLTYQDDMQWETAYLVQLYSSDLFALIKDTRQYSQLSFRQRLGPCLNFLKGFQLLSKQEINYSDISIYNILLTITQDTYAFHIGDFGGVERHSQCQERLINKYFNATPPEGPREIGDIIIPFRFSNMSLLDYADLLESFRELQELSGDDLTPENKEERIAHFRQKIFPELLAIKARQNVFAIGTLLCQTLTGGRNPYEIDKTVGFPCPNRKFDSIRLKSYLYELEWAGYIYLPGDLTCVRLPFSILESMLHQEPLHRPTLDSVLKNWNDLMTAANTEYCGERLAQLADQLAKEYTITEHYTPIEKAFLASRIGNNLTKDQALKIGTPAKRYSIGEYVIVICSNGHYQLVQILEGRDPIHKNQLILFHGDINAITAPLKHLYTINLEQWMREVAEEEEEKAEAPAVAAEAAAAAV